MARRGSLATLVSLLLFSALLAPASAGGWASVKLDGPPNPAYVEVPWSIGFAILQHDVTPVDVPDVFLSAQHRETGETIRADAVRAGATGHYLATVVFPLVGAWKWSITPGPFQVASFPTLEVLASPAESDAGAAPNSQAATDLHPAHIHAGTCDALGEVVHPLNDVGSGPMADGTPVPLGESMGTDSWTPVAISVTTIDAPLTELATGDRAINVHKSATEISQYVACGNIGGAMAGDELVVGLQQLNNSGNVGVAVLRADGEGAVVTLYLIVVEEQSPDAAATPAASATGAAIRITGAAQEAVFDPARIEVPAGAAVTWTNESDIPHTVTFGKLELDDSGPLLEGESFGVVFNQPGTYHYACDPHPWMSGTVVVV